MAAGEEAVALLRSIDASLRELVTIARGRAPKAVASDRELDSQYGDPTVKFNPRDWTGDSFKNCHMSQCPADFLELLAETFEYFASQAAAKNELTDKGKPVADYKRMDAARARGWAKRVRDGRVPAVASTGDDPNWNRGDEDGF